jgi:hypothetical protein
MFRRQSARAAVALRAVVRGLPASTAAAMYAGVERFPIITGAFVEPGGPGICLAVAANRAGNPGHPMAIDRAWDTFCGVRSGEVRYAKRGELAYITALLAERVFPACERATDSSCSGCGRRFLADLYGSCSCCGHTPHALRRRTPVPDADAPRARETRELVLA